MSELYGNFDQGHFDEIVTFGTNMENEDHLDFDDIMDFLADDFEFEATDAIASSVFHNAKEEMKEALNEIPTIELNQRKDQRFKKLTENDLKNLEDSRQSNSTKKNTKWGVKMIQEWSRENEGEDIDFHSIAPTDLCTKLRRFYAEAQPKNIAKRSEKMPENQAGEYHKNSLKNVRSAINRHLRDLNRDIDIVRDKIFRPANDLLDGKLKFNAEHGLSRPTTHKEVIPTGDLLKINAYLNSESNPVILRYRVWYNLAVHFVSRGIEFHKQLNTQSFLFKNDEFGREFVTISHDTKQKNHQGGLKSDEAEADKRMYATGAVGCPVESLRLFLHKTDPSAESLFNNCKKDAMESPDTHDIWYDTTACKPYQFTRFMGDISRKAGCSKVYTAHCLRATSIQAMNDAGFELRHIMFMSGHKNESSVRSYNRSCSTTQKANISNALAAVAGGSAMEMPPSSSSLVPRQESCFPMNFQIPFGQPSTTTSMASTKVNSAGFLSNSTFANCVFNFGK